MSLISLIKALLATTAALPIKNHLRKLFFVPFRLASDDLNVRSAFPPSSPFVDKHGNNHLLVCVRFCGVGEGHTILPSFLGRIAYILCGENDEQRDGDENKSTSSNSNNSMNDKDDSDVMFMKMSRGELYMKLSNQTECRFHHFTNGLDVFVLCKDVSSAPSDVLYSC